MASSSRAPGMADRIRQVLGNVLDNTLRHTTAAGAATSAHALTEPTPPAAATAAAAA